MLSDGWEVGVVLSCGDREHGKAWSGVLHPFSLES